MSKILSNPVIFRSVRVLVPFTHPSAPLPGKKTQKGWRDRSGQVFRRYWLLQIGIPQIGMWTWEKHQKQGEEHNSRSDKSHGDNWPLPLFSSLPCRLPINDNPLPVLSKPRMAAGHKHRVKIQVVQFHAAFCKMELVGCYFLLKSCLLYFLMSLLESIEKVREWVDQRRDNWY